MQLELFRLVLTLLPRLMFHLGYVLTCSMYVAEGGRALEISLIWMSYMTNPREFNAKWMPGTDDGTLRPSDSRLTSSQQGAQSIIRSYGDRQVRSNARIVLPILVLENMGKERILSLGFEDRTAKEGELKSNGFAIQIHILAKEALSVDLFEKSTDAQFEKVNRPQKIATIAPGAQLEKI